MWTGPEAMFLDAGFVAVAGTEGRPVLIRDLTVR